jgi:hypothetical protein
MRVVIARVSSLLAAARRHSTPAQPPQILPATLAMHALSGPGRNPLRDLWACPDPTVWRSLLQRFVKISLLGLREQGRCAQVVLPSIRQPHWPTLAVALGDLADGSWAAACRRLNLGQRQSVG